MRGGSEVGGRDGVAFTAAERRRYERDGYVLREALFDVAEIEELRETVEAVAARVVARAERPGAGPSGRTADGKRIQMSSRSAIQWEWIEGSRAIRLAEPCEHLDPRLEALAADERLLGLATGALGRDDVALYTTKLNLKRPEEGSEFPWHQDYPYWWIAIGDHANDVMTAFVLLDDATEENGALHLLAGSHRLGPAPRDPADPTRFLADPARLPDLPEVVAAAPAGSVLVFGSLLLHRSAPNLSRRHRRALLYSYQPAGRPRHHEMPWRLELVDQLP